VWGALPTHGGFRTHTVTFADNVVWIFGGCDDKGVFRFDIGTCAHCALFGGPDD
jgi:hypothetical protein